MEKTEMRNLPEVLRDEMVMRDRICDLLKKNPMTIPQLAEALGTHFDRGGMLLAYTSTKFPSTNWSIHHNMWNPPGK